MDNETAAGVIFIIAGAIFYLFILLFPIALILRKAGYSAWWVLMIFVPLGNLIMLWVFAFSNWPSLRRVTPGAPVATG